MIQFEQKKATFCQFFGGYREVVSNASRQRGDFPNFLPIFPKYFLKAENS